MGNTGHVRSVNVSERTGTRKKPVESGQIHIDPHHGVTGDAHAGDWHRQVSLLAWESIEKARAMGLDVKEGDFAENITTEGMDLLALPLGTQVKIGDEVVLELSQIGKVCHKKCAIYYLAGDCIFPREGIFFEVVTGGTVSVGDAIVVTKMGDGHCKYTPQEARDEIAKVIGFCGVTVGLGLATLAAVVLLLDLGPDTALFGMSGETRILAGSACLLLPSTYLLLSLFGRPIKVRSWQLDPPKPGLAVAQVAVGTLNFACVAACIHQLVSVFGNTTYFEVAGAYVTANVAALISHVPGGLGVLEATILNILPGTKIIGALVAFRVLYFFVPLVIGVPTFLVSEAYYRRHQFPLSENPAR